MFSGYSPSDYGRVILLGFPHPPFPSPSRNHRHRHQHHQNRVAAFIEVVGDDYFTLFCNKHGSSFLLIDTITSFFYPLKSIFPFCCISCLQYMR